MKTLRIVNRNNVVEYIYTENRFGDVIKKYPSGNYDLDLENIGIEEWVKRDYDSFYPYIKLLGWEISIL